MLNKTTFLFALILFTFCFNVNAQMHLMSEVSLDEQVRNSKMIVEGKVLSSKSMWNEDHTQIYSVSEIDVYKVFKGEPLGTVEVVTLGGVVGFEAEIVHPSLTPHKNEVGVFILEEENELRFESSSNTSEKFKPYAGSQSFYKYNRFDKLAANGFSIKNDINAFYNELKGLSGETIIDLGNFDFETYSDFSNNIAVAISSISPTTITAGTGSILTISGSGFGTTTGTVSFRDADTGGATYIDVLDSHIVSWNDTQIQVVVPASATVNGAGNAGTGTVRVTHASDTTFATSTTLTISWAVTNVPYDWGNGLGYQDTPTRHRDIDDNGGYTWQMFTDFDAASSPKATFETAFDSWRCETGINWTFGAVTTTDAVASDGINIIRFDNGELPSNVLGRCTSYYSANCGFTDGDLYWYVAEMDINFNEDISWYYSSDGGSIGFTEYDFESVAVHELGHGHQLPHVINSGAIMHYSIANSIVSRTLSVGDIAAGNDVQGRSVLGNPCIAEPDMTAYNCTASLEDQLLASGLEIYPNPTRGILQIRNNSDQTLESYEIYDISGRQILEGEFDDDLSTKEFNTSSLASGVYFIKVNSNVASAAKQFLKE